MPIISKVGRKATSVRILYTVLYLVLTVGGLTMLYPFLLMVATSMTSATDYDEYRLIPRYFYDDEAKFTKFINEKYNSFKPYSELHTYDYQAFRQVGLPTYKGDPDPCTNPRIDPQTQQETPPRVVIDTDWEHLEARVNAWREYQQSLDTIEFSTWYVGGSLIPGKVELMWRDELREVSGGDIGKVNKEFQKDYVGFTEIFAPYDQPQGRLWPGVRKKQGQRWNTFKKKLDPRYRNPINGIQLWHRHLRYEYEQIETFNKKMGTTFADFREIPLYGTVPENPKVAVAWEVFVRNKTPYRFIRIVDGDAKYRRFLTSLFTTLGDLKETDEQDRAVSVYEKGEDVKWPPMNARPNELNAISLFLRPPATPNGQPSTGIYAGFLDAKDFTVMTPDKAYAGFLKKKFDGSLEKLNAALDTKYTAFADIRPPIEEEDRWEFHEDAGAWMTWFLTRNYSEVVDYVAIRGRALWNTVILVGSMIICALTINPLAAYALSRFRLKYTNQVLLFLLATMAFPYEVAMIPNFLLLRRFPLWTWLTGLFVGLAVAALIIRFTQGKRKWMAIPFGLGSAVLAGFYITPLIGEHIFGIKEIGSVSLLNTYAALILPRMANGYSIFLLKGFFDSLPEELFEAGKIDGASELRMFWQVAFPLSRPIFAVMALQTFTMIYGSYIWALVVCQKDSMWTLMVYIFQLQQFAPQYVTMAATVLASLPTLLIFIIAQKTIMRGIIIPAYK